MDDRIFKNLPLTKFDFLKVRKSMNLLFINSAIVFSFHNVYKEKMFMIEIEDGLDAP